MIFIYFGGSPAWAIAAFLVSIMFSRAAPFFDSQTSRELGNFVVQAIFILCVFLICLVVAQLLVHQRQNGNPLQQIDDFWETVLTRMLEFHERLNIWNGGRGAEENRTNDGGGPSAGVAERLRKLPIEMYCHPKNVKFLPVRELKLRLGNRGLLSSTLSGGGIGQS